jgi:hypothetical protein
MNTGRAPVAAVWREGSEVLAEDDLVRPFDLQRGVVERRNILPILARALLTRRRVALRKVIVPA